MSVNMAGALPAGDSNGLGRILSKLINQPDEVHVGVVLFDCSKLTTATDTGDVTPTVRIRAVEPILMPTDSEEAQRLLRRAHADRTGQQQLPLDLEQAIDSWLLKVDTSTGEVPDDAGEMPTGPDWGDRDPDPPSDADPDADPGPESGEDGQS